MSDTIRIAALISGGGTNLQAIMDACESAAIDAEMLFVGSDNPAAKGLERAEKHHIPHFVADYKKIIRDFRDKPRENALPADFDIQDMRHKQSFFSGDADPEKTDFFLKSRAIAEAALLERMKDYDFDLLVLAGFMRNLSPYFIDRVNTDPHLPRIMNIHPALLPAFPGTDGYGDTFRYGCKIGGCTVHFIDYGEDSGPIIGQRSFAITAEDTLDTVKEKGLREEWILYPECIQLFAEKRLEIITRKDSRQKERRIVKIRAK
ncbi:MAG: phosphoribosylglycinamide formyltransferase [Desulfococcaceae bacterium]|jgi:phosphoribosylglycinamide formyltransferase-1|nr:phosphoribosylglycinamide formyltransferase [Desulfococcaceae bacterium]